jgi:large subunit ribosomal protein L23
MYGMIPVEVNMQVVEGKSKRFGRTTGKRKDWKKAIVTLPEGKKIEVYEGV